MGAMNAGGGELMSYLMFQSSFTRELIELGYSDAMAQSSKLIDFLHGSMLDTTGMTAFMKRLEMPEKDEAIENLLSAQQQGSQPE